MCEAKARLIGDLEKWRSKVDSIISTLAVQFDQNQHHSCLFRLDKQQVKDEIIGELEILLFGQKLDDNALQKSGSSFCAKLFRDGDLVFRCVDCCMDDTCSFCLECFRNSVHASHTYTSYRSSGIGGYCDCGDREAWTTDPTCAIHLKNGSVDLDDAWVQRAEIVVHYLFTYVLDIFFQLKNFKDSNTRPQTIEENQPHPISTPKILPHDDSYVIMVFNDESHSFREVISSMCSVTKCSEELGDCFAQHIDKYGIGIVYKTNDYDECCQTLDELKDYYVNSFNKAPLLSYVATYRFYWKLRLLDFIMTFIGDLCTYSEKVRNMVGECVVNPIRRTLFEPRNQAEWIFDTLFETYTNEEASSVASFFIYQNVHLWKEIRDSARINLFMMILPLEPIKYKVAEIYSKKCETLYLQEFSDDHAHGYSILNIFVQIFTAKTVAWFAIEKTKMLSGLITVLGDLGHRINYGWNRLSIPIHDCISHANDLLLHCPSPSEWRDSFNEPIYQSFKILVKQLLEDTELPLFLLRGSQIRRFSLYDGVSVYITLAEGLLYRFYRWICSEKKLYSKCLKYAISYFYGIHHERLSKLRSQDEDIFQIYYSTDLRTEGDFDSQDFSHRMMNSHFININSFHYMKLLLRVIILLLTRCHKFNFQVSDFINTQLNGDPEFCALDFFNQSFDTTAIYFQDSCRFLATSSNPFHTILTMLYIKTGSGYFRSILDKYSLQISLQVTDPITVFNYYRECFFTNFGIFFAEYQRLLESDVTQIEKYNNLIYWFYVTIYQVATYRHNQFIYENNDPSHDKSHTNDIFHDVFIHQCANSLCTMDQLEDKYKMVCYQLGVEFRYPSMVDLASYIFDVRVSSLENVERFVLKPKFLSHINIFSIYYSNDIYNVEEHICEKIENNVLTDYRAGLETLPFVSGKLGEDLFAFITNKSLIEMIIKSLQVNKTLQLEKRCINIIVHICYLVIHDASRLAQNSYGNAIHMLKSFFVYTPFPEHNDSNIMSLLRQLNPSSFTVTAQRLYTQIIRALECDYQWFNPGQGNFPQKFDTKESSTSVTKHKVDHKKLAMERIKRMQKNFVEKNAEAREFLESIEVENKVVRYEVLDGSIPLIGPKKATSEIPLNNTKANFNCVLCQDDNQFDLYENKNEELFRWSGYEIFCFLSHSNLFGEYFYPNSTLLPSEEPVPVPQNPISCLYMANSYGFNQNYVAQPQRSSGLHFGGCGHFSHKSCLSNRAAQMSSIDLFSNQDLFASSSCPLCYSKQNLLIPCVVSNQFNRSIYNNYNQDGFDFADQLQQFDRYMAAIENIDFDNDQVLITVRLLPNFPQVPLTTEEIFSNLNQEDLFDSSQPTDSSRIYLLLSAMVYSVQCYEVNTRIDKFSLVGSASAFFDTYRIHPLRYTIRYVVFLAQTYGYNFNLFTTFTKIFVGILKQLRPVITNQHSNNLYQIDYFKTMIVFYVCAVSLVRVCGLKAVDKVAPNMCHVLDIEKFCVTLFYTLHSVQCVKILPYFKDSTDIPVDDADLEKIKTEFSSSAIDDFVTLFHSFNAIRIEENLRYHYFYKWITLVVPFLRSTTIFFHLLHDQFFNFIPDNHDQTDYDVVQEYIGLIKVLDLPSDFTLHPYQMINTRNYFSKLTLEWKNYKTFSVDELARNVPIFRTLFAFVINSFALASPLPRNHLDLLQLALDLRGQICSKNSPKRDDCGLCLVCKEWMCLCEECNPDFFAYENHSRKCPGKCCVILSAIKPSVNFSYGEQVSKSFPYPYINLHGNSRHNTKYCSSFTYDQSTHLELMKIWRYHTIHHTMHSNL